MGRACRAPPAGTSVKKKILEKIKPVLNKLPYIRTLYANSRDCAYPSGHYYSPIVSFEDVKQREDKIWQNVRVDGIEGMNLRTEEQIKLIHEFEQYYAEIPFKDERQPNIRFNYVNNYYCHTDAIVLYSVIRHFKPKRIVEIGSGFSSAVMLDTNEFFFNNEIQLTFIDPHLGRLNSIITESDQQSVEIIETDVQLVSLDLFKKLNSGDILFIDSTHVSKTGSDVNYILFEILPILEKGVLIHFHDIFYPFEYPKEWVYKGLNWNEDYIVRAFLMYNDNFKIRIFSHYLHKLHHHAFEKLPLSYSDLGSNLWIEKY